MATNKMRAILVPLHQSRRNDSPDLRTPRLLAKWPIIGLLLFIFGSLMFGGLAHNLYAHGPLLAWDQTIANTLPAMALQSPPWVKAIIVSGFYIGNAVIIILGILIGIYFIIKHFWQELVMLAIGMVGEALLFFSLSNFIGRARPETQIWDILKIPGFPSGHSMITVVFFGLIAYLLTPNIESVFWKGIVIAAAVFLMIFVGFCRVVTGGHYLTDVLAGYALGIAWSGMAYTLIELYYQKRRSPNVKKG
jgi:membrane-associated phospholipid phosphatase